MSKNEQGTKDEQLKFWLRKVKMGLYAIGKTYMSSKNLVTSAVQN